MSKKFDKAIEPSRFELLKKAREEFIDTFENHRSSQGKMQYLLFVHGEKLSYEQAIRAKCYECGLRDSLNDCVSMDCPLYQFIAL